MDGLIRAANIHIAIGTTNRSITKLYPLEVTASDVYTPGESLTSKSPSPQSTSEDVTVTTDSPPVREAATRACKQMLEWCDILRGPPEDITN